VLAGTFITGRSSSRGSASTVAIIFFGGTLVGLAYGIGAGTIRSDGSFCPQMWNLQRHSCAQMRRKPARCWSIPI
jgi:hypothetical protein